MKKEQNKKEDSWFKDEELERGLRLTPEQRLLYLEELNAFLNAFMPKESRIAWEKLKEEGW